MAIPRTWQTENRRILVVTQMSDAHLRSALDYCDREIDKADGPDEPAGSMWAARRATIVTETLRRQGQDLTQAALSVCTPLIDAPEALDVLTDRLLELDVLLASERIVRGRVAKERERRRQRTRAYEWAYAHTTNIDRYF